MNAVIVVIFSLVSLQADTLSLTESYRHLQNRYPLQDKLELEQDITELKLQNLHTRYYPQVDLQARGSYQSHVTEITFTPPGVPAPQFHKDQYSAEMQVSQLLYDGGGIQAQKEQIRSQGDIQKARVRVDMHEVRKLVDRIYFNILRINKSAATLRWSLKKIESQREQVKSLVNHGVLLSSNLHVLNAEIGKLEQELISLKHDRRASSKMLGKLLDISVDTTTVLRMPEVETASKAPLDLGNRPEYDLFAHQTDLLTARQSSIEAEKGPRLSVFATAGYGRPGLNRFDPEFQHYYMIGVQAKWSLWDLLNADEEVEQVQMEQKKITADRRAFNRQMRSTYQKYREEVEKMESLIKKDRQIIEQREKIVEQSKSQLKNGTITSSDYVEEVYEAKKAKLQLELHQVEKVYARVQLLTQMNQSWN